MLNELPVPIDQALNRIRTDHTSGAHALTTAVCELIEEIIEELPAEQSGEYVLDLMATLGRQIITAQPSMAPLRHLFRSLLVHLEETPAGTGLTGRASRFLESYRERLREMKFRVARHAAFLIKSKKTIMTHSFSSMVIESFRQAKLEHGDFEVIVTESRPVLEGRLASMQLSQFGIPVRIIVDAAAVSHVEQCDLILLGADRLTDIDFINKIGSLSIVMAARTADVPRYVLTGSDKYLSEADEPVTLTGSSGDEVWDAAPSGIVIENPYFERIPLRLVTGIISESGVTSYGQYAEKKGPFFEHM